MTIIEERTVLVGNQSAENWRRENAPDGLSHQWNPFGSGFDLAAIGALAKSARVMPPPASPTSAGATHDYAVENVVLGDEGHHRQRRSKRADALIAGAYFAGTSMRRVCWALAALFGGAAGKDTVSRVWRKARGDWDAWNGRSLADEPIVRLILDGTVRVRLDRQKRTISLLVALLPDGDPGVR